MEASKIRLLRLLASAFGVYVLLLIGGMLFRPTSAETQEITVPAPALVRETSPISTHVITPSEMSFFGDVVVCGGVIPDPTVASWCNGVPTGTIMLGVDPSSPNPSDWDGGQATASIYIGGIVSPTVGVLSVTWPDRDGKGLHSPERYHIGAIAFDGERLWDKRTLAEGTFHDYYAAEYEPILTTVVLTQSITHTLTFSVSIHTAWDMSRIELALYPYPTKVRGIAYGALRDCQFPGGAAQPSSQDIREDLLRLFHTGNALRTYSAAGTDELVVRQANALGLPIFAGAWIDYPTTTAAQDNAESQALIHLACTSDLDGAIVGNEYYLRHQKASDLDYLRQRIQQVKTGIQGCGKSVPVTTAELDTFMFNWNGSEPAIKPEYRPILDEVDFIMVHIYPFWNGLPIDGAAAFTVNRYKAIQTLIEQEYPGQGKRVIIGEAGWPSAGVPNGRAVPNMRNQRRYMLEFLPLAEQEGVEYLYFSAFDGLWKVEEPGEVGRHWGYGYGDRMAKHDFYGVLVPAERLPPPPLPLSHTVYLPHVSGSGINPAFYVYSEWMEKTDHFIPSGYMGDLSNISMYECDRTNPHSGELSIQVSFSPTGTQGWAGVYWQDPANNWGKLPGGYDLTGADRLTFWVRGQRGGETVEFLVGGLGAPTDPYRDTIRPARSTGPTVLSDQWERHEISLAGAELSRVIGGFAWVASRADNSAPIIFYLDDIHYEFD